MQTPDYYTAHVALKELAEFQQKKLETSVRQNEQEMILRIQSKKLAYEELAEYALKLHKKSLKS